MNNNYYINPRPLHYVDRDGAIIRPRTDVKVHRAPRDLTTPHSRVIGPPAGSTHRLLPRIRIRSASHVGRDGRERKKVNIMFLGRSV